MDPKANVDWSEYASQYDLLCSCNPAYQELLEAALDQVQRWNLSPGSVLADLGGGTGNLSVELARRHPEYQVLHVERDLAMNARAEAKARDAGLANWRVLAFDLEGEDLPLPELDGMLSVNALYTLRNPRKTIRLALQRLRAGGRVFATSFGRRMSVSSWGAYLVRQNLRVRGARATWGLFRGTSLARRANNGIRRAQKSGLFWMHDLAAFTRAFSEAGLRIEGASAEFYRGCNDTLNGTKQAS